MKKFLKITLRSFSLEQMDVLMSELADIGFYAFEQNDNALAAYVLHTDFDEKAFKKILPHDVVYELLHIDDKNWNEEWENNFYPVVVGDFAGVRASFHDPVKNVKHDIIITPKMSFGTGHHATTYLMIEAMQQINFTNKTVLDFGTGTGILAILAEKSGASSVIAIDSDEWSISNAKENVAANKCTRINVQQRDNIKGISGVDIITANISLNVLTENVESLAKALNDSTSLILVSGILASDEEEIIRRFHHAGLLKKEINLKSGWISILFEKQ